MFSVVFLVTSCWNEITSATIQQSLKKILPLEMSDRLSIDEQSYPVMKNS